MASSLNGMWRGEVGNPTRRVEGSLPNGSLTRRVGFHITMCRCNTSTPVRVHTCTLLARRGDYWEATHLKVWKPHNWKPQVQLTRVTSSVAAREGTQSPSNGTVLAAEAPSEALASEGVTFLLAGRYLQYIYPLREGGKVPSP